MISGHTIVYLIFPNVNIRSNKSFSCGKFLFSIVSYFADFLRLIIHAIEYSLFLRQYDNVQVRFLKIFRELHLLSKNG